MSLIKSLIEDAAQQGFPDMIADMLQKSPSQAHEIKDNIIDAAKMAYRQTSSNILKQKAAIFISKVEAALVAPDCPLKTLFDDLSARSSLSLLLAHTYYTTVAPKNSVGEKIFADFPSESEAKEKAGIIIKQLSASGLQLPPEIKEPLEKLLVKVLFKTDSASK